MGKKESAQRIVRIGIRFDILVMDAMIATPMVNTALVGNTIREHEQQTDRPVRFVTPVRPETVDTDSDTETTVVCIMIVVSSLGEGCVVCEKERGRRIVQPTTNNRNVPNGPEQKGPQQCFGGTLSQFRDSNNGHNVDQGQVNEHGPIDIALLIVIDTGL